MYIIYCNNPTSPGRCIEVHPTNSYILTSSDDMMIKLWDWNKAWACIQTFEGHSHYVMQVAFNPKDTNSFASASLDKTIRVRIHFSSIAITGLGTRFIGTSTWLPYPHRSFYLSPFRPNLIFPVFSPPQSSNSISLIKS